MKKYDTNKMLEEWSSGSSLSGEDPYPPSADTPGDTEDLINSAAPDMTTNIPGPDAYETNKNQVTEANASPEKEVPTQGPMPTPEEDPSMGVDPSMVGMPPPVGPQSTFEVGRIYELKKIYSRLVSMQSYLAGTTDPNLIKLRNYVSNTMDLFRTLISNIALYKDRLDEIIIVFYNVVTNVYSILSKYYKDKDSGKMVQAIENTLYVRKRSNLL